jgi:nucleotide-binding universal stress UspA family protein
MNILIAYDGSPCADSALEDLPRAGLPTQAEARIVSIAEVFMPPPAPPDLPASRPPSSAVQQARAEALQAVATARNLAGQAAVRVQALFPSWTVSTDASADSPAWGVIKLADAWSPDLIVVGSHGRSVLSRFVLGSVSQTIVTHARSSVRVARPSRHPGSAPVRLLIGVDGSPDAEAAVAAMAARAWPAGSTAMVVAIREARMPTMLVPGAAFLEKWFSPEKPEASAWLHTMLEAMQQPLQAAGLTVTTVIRDGNPQRLLPTLAEEWEADCLVVGARGLSRVERFLMGSVSAAVAARAPCSVEVIRPRTASMQPLLEGSNP